LGWNPRESGIVRHSNPPELHTAAAEIDVDVDLADVEQAKLLHLQAVQLGEKGTKVVVLSVPHTTPHHYLIETLNERDRRLRSAIERFSASIKTNYLQHP